MSETWLVNACVRITFKAAWMLCPLPACRVLKLRLLIADTSESTFVYWLREIVILAWSPNL